MVKLSRILLTLLAVIISAAANADLAIIVHPDYAGGELDQELVKAIFLNERTEFPSGHTAIPANHSSGSSDRKAFFEYVLDMGDTRYKRYWQRKQASGKKGMPEELDSHAEILNWVAKNPLGISYIDKTRVNDSVKVLFTVFVFDDL